MSITVTFYGVRGSIPSPGNKTNIYGGNTPCITLKHHDNIIILDAGTGIRVFGRECMAMKNIPSEYFIFISHTHWDHIQGLPFFAPAFAKASTLNFFGPESFYESFSKIISNQMKYAYFPIRFASLHSEKKFTELEPGIYDNLIPGVTVQTCLLNHPITDLGYSFITEGRKISYITDFEYYSDLFIKSVRKKNESYYQEIEKYIFSNLRDEITSFIAGADLLIIDASYTDEEYKTRTGWGHSTFDDIYLLAKKARVKNLCFFHHETNRDDDELESIEKKFIEKNKIENAVESVFAAREGMKLNI